MGQRVDDVRLDAEKSQLEDLEEPSRAGTDDDRIGFDRRRGRHASVVVLGQGRSPRAVDGRF
jgi:hypothetical protein